MLTSHSTDKLQIVCDTAKELVKNSPNITEKLKSISIVWTKVDGIAVPDIKIELYE